MTGKPQDVQQGWRRITDGEVDVVATGAVAGRIVITGVVGMADTNETVAIGEAAVAGIEATEAEAGVMRGATVAEAG